MRQFDVHRFVGRSASIRPYLVIVQSNLFARHDRWLAIPIVHRGAFPGTPDRILNPAFQIEGAPMALDTLDLASFPQQAFGRRVCSLEDDSDRIVAALDLAMARGYG